VAHRGGRAVHSHPGRILRVPDFAESPVDAISYSESNTALRDLRREGKGERIRAFEQVPTEYLS